MQRSAVHTYYSYRTTSRVDQTRQTGRHGNSAGDLAEHVHRVRGTIQNQRNAQLPAQTPGERAVELQRPLLRPPPGQRTGQDEIALRQRALRRTLGESEL